MYSVVVVKIIVKWAYNKDETLRLTTNALLILQNPIVHENIYIVM